MATVLVVDDSATDRHLAGSLLEKRPGLTALEKRTGLTAVYANDGQEALALCQRELPDLVVTDLQMPHLNGLELVEALKSKHPSLPVILMTGQGSEDIAIQALRLGAASYVPKKNLVRDLLETVEEVLGVAQAKRSQQRLTECLVQTSSVFVLDNDLALTTPLIGYHQEVLTHMKLCDGNGIIRVAVALREAMANAIIHGNLEVSTQLLESDEKAYHRLLTERRQQKPYQDRRVHVNIMITLKEAVYIIRDEGPGFDFYLVPDPTDPANLERPGGRGLLLIQNFMDEMHHNQEGNEITLVKRRDPSAAPASPDA
jgi:CheY-like chemotaxis protein/anti-sigma regulatory factor (Ser/Thr protein kinase)